jgi:hypothetical protein
MCTVQNLYLKDVELGPSAAEGTEKNWLFFKAFFELFIQE